MTGGLTTTLAQFDVQKIGEGVTGPIREAQGESAEKLAEGMAGTTAPATEPEEAEPIKLEDIPDDTLRQAIEAVAEFRSFADSATGIVRSYITQINIQEDAIVKTFEPGTEPWLSKKSEIRYSPFDPVLIQPPMVDLNITQQPPFLPPLGPAKPGVTIDALRPLIKLRMTSRTGDEWLALAEIAGMPVHLTVGEEIDPQHTILPQEYSVRVEAISIDSVLFVSGSESLRVPFAGPLSSTEEKPFEIEIGR
jgi:hypothetical protein